MFKPLLAEAVNLETLRYPTWASPKYDGFRCVINQMRQPVSRNLKPVANAYVFGKLSELNLPQLDGELLTYTNDKVDDFNTVQSKLSTRSGMPDFQYMVFDYWANPSQPYGKRNSDIRDIFGSRTMPRLHHVQQTQVDNETQLLDYEARCLSEGWEGVMVRDPDLHYKFGRSTTKEGILLKLKRFFDAEAVVVSAHELMHNANEGKYNALGHLERSSHQANMQPMGMLGKFTVKWKGREVEFDIGTGFNESQRREYWTQDYTGKTLTFKYQSVGPNGKPRFPVFLGFRADSETLDD